MGMQTTSGIGRWIKGEDPEESSDAPEPFLSHGEGSTETLERLPSHIKFTGHVLERYQERLSEYPYRIADLVLWYKIYNGTERRNSRGQLREYLNQGAYRKGLGFYYLAHGSTCIILKDHAGIWQVVTVYKLPPRLRKTEEEHKLALIVQNTLSMRAGLSFS